MSLYWLWSINIFVCILKGKKKPVGDSSLAYEYSITSCIIKVFIIFIMLFAYFPLDNFQSTIIPSRDL